MTVKSKQLSENIVKTALFAGLAFSALGVQADTRYSMTVIENPNGSEVDAVTPVSINSQKVVVGYVGEGVFGSDYTSAFLYDQNGNFVDVDAQWKAWLDAGQDYSGSSISDINNNGAFVGYVRQEIEPDLYKHTAVFQSGDQIQAILPDENCLADEINDKNQILLRCLDDESVYVYENGNIMPLSPLSEGGTQSYAMINNNGVVAGAEYDGQNRVPNLFKGGVTAYLNDLSAGHENGIEESITAVLDINDQDEILVGIDSAGASYTSYIMNADGSQIRAIAALPDGNGSPGLPNAVNNKRSVVGASRGSAFVNTEADGTVDLNSAIEDLQGYRLEKAVDVNDDDIIIGTMTGGNPVQSGFIATPLEEDSNDFKPTGFMKWVTDENYQSGLNSLRLDVPDGATSFTVHFLPYKGRPSVGVINHQNGTLHQCSSDKRVCQLSVDDLEGSNDWQVLMSENVDFNGIVMVRFK